MMPLGFLSNGQCGVVANIVGGKSVLGKLTGMGLCRGTSVSMVKNDGSGPLIIALGDGRLALGRGMSQKVIIDQVK